MTSPLPRIVARLSRPDRSRAQEVVLEELRRVILSGDAPPGSAIPLEEVATGFGVSVIPVREALKTLIGEGLVDHRPRGGYAVARLTPAELEELYVVRGVLEQAAVAAAVLLATDEHRADARDAHDALTAAQSCGDHDGYHRESRRFHLALVEPAGMPRLRAMLESAWNLTEPYRPMARIPADDRGRLHGDHAAMLDAFTAGDADTLLTLTAEHHDRLRSAIGALAGEPGVFAGE